MTTPSAITASYCCDASAAATTGSSNVPGTRTTTGASTWWAVKARSAPASRPSMTWACQLAATTATRRSWQSVGCAGGPPCPAMSDRSCAQVARSDVSGKRHLQVGEMVTHPVPLGQQVGQVVVVRVWRERYPLGDLDPVVLEVAHLLGVVGQQPDLTDPEVPEDLGRRAVVPGVGRQSEIQVGVHGVAPALLELVGLQLGHQPDAAALVPAQVDDDATALSHDPVHRLVELRTTVAAAAAEDVAGQALRVHPGEDRLAVGEGRRVAVHEGHVLAAVDGDRVAVGR